MTPDVWVYLFDLASAVTLSSSDLYSAVRVCRIFYSAAIRPLYRHIFWHNPIHFTASIPRLQEEGIATAPLSLYISCSILPPTRHTFKILHEGGHTDTIICADTRFQHILSNIQPNSRPSHLVTVEVFSQMTTIAKTFARLETLSLTNHIISDGFYDLLRCVLHLRVLEVSSCHLEIGSGVLGGNLVVSERLEELMFRNITFRHQPSFSVLVTAPNLSSLSFDRTSGVFFPIPELQGACKKLTTLQVFDTVSWTVEQMSQYDTMMVALAFINRSPALRNFSTDISLLPPLALGLSANSPVPLGTYRGPVSTLLKMTSSGVFRGIDALEIVNGQKTLAPLFSFISHSVWGLRRVAISMKYLDHSLPGALAQLTGLKALSHILFHVEDPFLVGGPFTTQFPIPND